MNAYTYIIDTYEYIDSWKRFDETPLSDADAFDSSLNMQGIISED